MFVLVQKIKKPYDEIPSSPGIPGDYFECDEMMLVKKLNSLRSRGKDAARVPSLLDKAAGDAHGGIDGHSVESMDLEPDSFFAIISDGDGDEPEPEPEQEIESKQQKTPRRSNGAGVRNVHSSPRRRLDLHATKTKPSKSPANTLSPNTTATATSTTFSAIPEDKESSTTSSTDISPKSTLVKFSESDNAKNVLIVKTRRPRSRLSHNTPATESISHSRTSSHSQSHASRRRRHELREKFRFPSEVTLEKIHESVDGSSPLHHDLIIKHSSTASTCARSEASTGTRTKQRKKNTNSNMNVNSSLAQQQQQQQQQWQETNSVQEGEDDTSIPSIPEEESLYVKLADKQHLETFKVINNFSYEGDHLFTSILREQTRIQLKRKMIQEGEIDLLCQLQALERKKKSPSRSRGLYYAI